MSRRNPCFPRQRETGFRSGVWIGAVCAAVVGGSEGLAQTMRVYEWRDPQGVTHFSAEPPDTSVVPRVRSMGSARQPGRNSGESMPPYLRWLEVANDLEASRLERERARREAAMEQQRLGIDRSGGEAPPETPVPVYGYVPPRPYPCTPGYSGCPPPHAVPRVRRPESHPGGGPLPWRASSPRNLPQTGDPTVNRYLDPGPFWHVPGPAPAHPVPRTAPAIRMR